MAPNRNRERAEEEAEAVLRSVWHQIVGDHGSFPVDPVRIATVMGIDVIPIDFSAEVSGALSKRPGEDPQIFLNAEDSRVRRRFTTAHELGHYISRVQSEDDSYEYVDLRDTIARQGTDPDEIFANSFAASLLMPAPEVKARREQGRQLSELAYYFGVSQEAMGYRLANLGIPVRN